MQQFVGKFLATFKESPSSQKPASFSVRVTVRYDFAYDGGKPGSGGYWTKVP